MGATEIDPVFVWYHLINTLIKELNITEKQAYKMNYIHVLNWLSYFKNVNDVREAKEKMNK
jgi:hypothetical protein